MVKGKVIKEISNQKSIIQSFDPIRVCAYVRVSPDHDKQLSSFNSQSEFYNRRFIGNPQYIFIGLFSDAGISGAKKQRPGFQKMLTKSREGKVDLIYTKSISRFARNTLMLLEIVRELRDIGVGIVFEEENIHTLRSEGELMLSILASIAEEERKSVRSNVKWGLIKKYLRGEVMVDTARLLGYEKDKSGKLVIVPK
ncbi:recombinase family protein [Alkalibacter mobilis]|uniref:recombinase family protein n=1 Tax=Alkalibacter mobilis TaxID=2787712 RepID=UPI00189D3F95|nr:recombinase family protein [Alkalibacter mobilis]MBF7097665.1 recombinase family protein [Alkalibacter mobilis]